VELLSKYKSGPLFTPPVVSRKEGPLGTLMLPMNTGGTNWPGGSYDPETHLLYVFSQTVTSSIGLVPPDPKTSDMNFVQGSATAGVRRTPGVGGGADAAASPDGRGANGEGSGVGVSVRGLPLVKPPYGRITAIDLDKGDIVWQIAHGETPDAIRTHPALKGVSVPRTGRPGYIGTLVTKRS
jgi:quinoprotein glucose dehydrogenase